MSFSTEERRRRVRRVPGTQVRVLCGAVPRRAVLSDVSGSGCGIEMETPPARGQSMLILLPRSSRFRLPPTVSARIVRSDRVSGAVFTRIPERARESLRLLIERGRTPDGLADEPGPGPHPERRDDRRAYDARLTALASRLPHELVARDLSTEGLRVDPLPWAEVGTRFEVSFSVPHANVPMALTASLLRHDGPRGTVLRFVDMEPGQAEALRELLTLLPRLDDDRDVILLTEVA